MIQTHVRDARTNALIEIGPNDPRYWQGPYVYQPYPKALYRVTELGQKEAETIIVKSEREHHSMGSDWHESPDLAKAHFQRVQDEVFKAAAEVNASTAKMSQKAQDEKLAHDRVSEFTPVVDVPAPKKRGRPAKKSSEVPA